MGKSWAKGGAWVGRGAPEKVGQSARLALEHVLIALQAEISDRVCDCKRAPNGCPLCKRRC